jgi:hypothetical protein
MIKRSKYKEFTSLINIIKIKNAGLNVYLFYLPCINEAPAALSKSLKKILGTKELFEFF